MSGSSAFFTRVIEQEARKLVLRHQGYIKDLTDEFVRRDRRSGVTSIPDIRRPAYWAADTGFDPYYVRAHSTSIAYGLSRALDTGSYRPRPAVIYRVPKPGGGEREIPVFQVADNALSRQVYLQLMRKNAARFSSRCYAYRHDVTLHDAILYVAAEFRANRRLFLAEFDFRKFFDTISRDYIERLLRDDHFLITNHEMRIIQSFLRAPRCELGSYDRHASATPERGVPQGTSISLFLANVAAAPLDRKLERLGVGFARYADDTLIWSPDYAEVCRAVNALHETAEDMGVKLNLEKSDGVSLLIHRGERAEFKSKTHVQFLGYSLSKERVSVKPRKVRSIKEWLSYLVYVNLLQPLKRGQIVTSRFAGHVDRDYVTMVFQIRRYLYGELSESRLARYRAKTVPRMRFHGLLSAYPLVDDHRQLSSLDGWLLHTIVAALKLRTKLLARAGHHTLPPPHGLTRQQLLQLRIDAPGLSLDLRLPSFARIASLIRRAAMTYGPSVVVGNQDSYDPDAYT